MVTTELFAQNEQALHARVLKLERRVHVLLTVVRLLLVVVRLFGLRLDSQRVPSGEAKSSILVAIKRARKRIPLAVALRVIGLSASRYHAWLRLEQSCGLDDRTSCPRTIPNQLTSQEIASIQQMVTADEYRHLPLRPLALLAQRLGRVFASPSIWARLVRLRGWRRPRRRRYPPKPKLGIRATRPNERWHLDTTIIRLLDGTRAYLHAVIDGFSRKILAWHLADKLEPAGTCRVLTEAAKLLPPEHDAPEVFTDSGPENVNGQVDALIEQGLIRRVLAQVEVVFSNSLIEAWWRSLRYNWLYLNDLESVAPVRKLVAFYVAQHNTVPHSVFNGETPDEMYASTADGVAERLAEGRERAREARLAANRALSCEDCVLERRARAPTADATPDDGTDVPRPREEAM